MMKAFGTDTSRSQQPSSVYTLNNELYIKGTSPDVIPPVIAPPAATSPAAVLQKNRIVIRKNSKENSGHKDKKDKGKHH
ncbi:hypothetical protein GCM10020331_052010 [Ectobacillus funiculus]